MADRTTSLVDDITKHDIAERFKALNRLYFNDELGKCSFFRLSPNRSTYGKYIHQPSKSGICDKIGIARNTLWTEETLMEILVHEMIHMYVRTVENVRIDGLLGHGRHFRKHCRRLKKDYDLVIRKHPDFGYINKKLSPKFWERALLWVIDW